MALTLTAETEQRIGALVEAGRFASPQQVIEAAIERLEADELLESWAPGELQAAVQVGLDASQRGEVISSEEFTNRLDALLEGL